MISSLETILTHFLNNVAPDLSWKIEESKKEETAVALNNAFLIALSGSARPEAAEARAYLGQMANHANWGDAAHFYQQGLRIIPGELRDQVAKQPDFAQRLEGLADWLVAHPEPDGAILAEQMWRLFFPEGASVLAARAAKESSLRARRRVTIDRLNPQPITDPTRQILFTSNVLLTIPAAGTDLEALPYDDTLKQQIRIAMSEPQGYWFDHPIQIGVAPEANELLYGLRGLDEMMAYEKEQGNVPADERLTCLLSVSVTHEGLKAAAKPYLAFELASASKLHHPDLFLFTEMETAQLIDKVLAPAAEAFLADADIDALRLVFGVDGRYGRHYSFLKAIGPLWQIVADDRVRATFKIDLDQVFPQPVLAAETGQSALAHFTTPLWGATGIDADGNALELGMMAGLLVNERDIDLGLFTPDVTYPTAGARSPDEYIFFSKVPQALSTQGEMMTRYNTPDLNGTITCQQRIHVTGGTIGILNEALRQFRPFTPTFVGRAEDQAYILSVINQPNQRLAYVHEDGLVMLHDKHAFAQEAIKAAATSTLVGDYVRTLIFSAYANALTDGKIETLKAIVDPFTGCFISPIPISVVYLRFALKALDFFQHGRIGEGAEFVRDGAARLLDTLAYVSGTESDLRRRLAKERRGWGVYYDALDVLAQKRHDTSKVLIEKGKAIIAGTAVKGSPAA